MKTHAPTTALVALLVLCGATDAANTTATTTTSSTTAAKTNSTTGTNSTRCDEELLFQKLYVLMPAINQCAKEADYYINTDALVLPTDEALAKYCKSENCTKLSAELDDAGLPSCTVAVGTTEVPFKEFFNQIKEHCTSINAVKAKSAAQLTAGGWRAGLALLVTAVALCAAAM